MNKYFWGAFALVMLLACLANIYADSLMKVYGYVKRPNNVAIAGAVVSVTFATGTNQVLDSSTGIIISDANTEVNTDSTGYFFFNLRRTSNYVDVKRGKYNIIAHFGQEVVFEALNITVPASGDSMNVGDSLANRQ